MEGARVEGARVEGARVEGARVEGARVEGARVEGADHGWRLRAVCRDEDPELFFPIGTTGPAYAQIEAAKAVCRRCPVSGRCLTWALSAGEDVGVWGGLDEEQRRALRVGVARSRLTSVTRVPSRGRRS